MIKNISNEELGGDLNYILTHYLTNLTSISQVAKQSIISEKNLNFGEIYDIDLEKHHCNYEIRREIYSRLEGKNLEEIYSTFKQFISHSDGENEKIKEIVREERNKQPEQKEKKDQKENSLNGFQMMRKGGVIRKEKLFNQRDEADEKIKSFKHMKSILGHISVMDENLINPVPIYCICFSNDNELIFSGDDNGLIKIWSSRTGALVDIFESHEKAINDILLHEHYLVSCSDDMSVKIWDINNLSLIKTINFDECIIQVIAYEFKNQAKNKNNNIIIASSASGKIFLFDLGGVIQLANTSNTNNTSNSTDKPQEYENETYVSKIYFDKKIIEKYNLKKVKNNLAMTCMTAHNRSGIMVCGFNEGIVCVWDLEKILNVVITNKRFIHEFDKYVLFLEYVHSSITQISQFNKKGDYFLTASLDGLVLVWKVQEEVIAKMRLSVSHNSTNELGLYPIYSIFKLTEGENKVRCSVNSALWSSCNNYIIAMISSKHKKKSNANNTSNEIGNNFNTANNQNNQANHPNESPSHNQSNSYKRSSAILVYDVNANKQIRRFDSENGFDIHDECYVLESHPIDEEVVLTVTNSNEIILFNFITSTILCKFTEENYFFSNVTQSMVASEGKFSMNGDSFVISTYLGSISIYNIYSKASFNGTYMNQFFNEEFHTNNSPSLLSETSFTNYVNMYNLPYIVQQPYSKFKLQHLEDNVYTKLVKNYNYSMKEIKHKLMNNYECYEKNLTERQYECEREETIFIQAAKENLTYFIPENVADNLEESEAEAFSEYNLDNEHEHGVVREVEDHEEELDSFSDSQMMEIDSDNNNNRNNINSNNRNRNSNSNRNRNERSSHRVRNRNTQDEGAYNLRSRGSNANAALPGRNTRRNNTNQSNTNEDNSRVRGNLRNRSRSQIQNNSNSLDNNNNEDGLLLQNENILNDEVIVEIDNTRQIRRKKLGTRRMVEDDDDYSFNNEIEDSVRSLRKDDDNDQFSVKSDSKSNNEDNSDYDSKVYKEVSEHIFKFGKEIGNLVKRCSEVEDYCFLCKFQSFSLIGPFITENYIDFTLDKSSNSRDFNEEELALKNEKFYFHIDCVLLFNDYIITDNVVSRHKSQNDNCAKINLSKTIKEIVQNNKECWRCKMTNATKKCFKCDKYFHGHFCLPKYCLEVENDKILCLECYREKNIDTKENTILAKNKNIQREFFSRDKFSFYTFYPQLNDKVYFILQAYEDFLRNSFENIIMESDSEIFFWNDKEINYTKPFLCEIVELGHSFSNLKTINLLKKMYKNKSNWQDKLQIITKLKLKIIESNKLIEIVFFKNDLPDFLVNAVNFEKALIIYDQMVYNKFCDNNIKSEIKNENNEIESEKTIEIVIADTHYQTYLEKFHSRELNDTYKDSLFESITARYALNENFEREELRISFWDLYNPELEDISHNNLQLKDLMTNLHSEIERIYTSNSNKYYPFVDQVDEVRDKAVDYYNHIPVPMHLNLIKNRLKNNYYVSVKSIESDLEQLQFNALMYNSEKSQITKCSKELVREIKKSIIALTSTNNNNNNNSRNRSNILNIPSLPIIIQDKNNMNFDSNKKRSTRLTKQIGIAKDFLLENNSNRKSLRNRNTKPVTNSYKNSNSKSDDSNKKEEVKEEFYINESNIVEKAFKLDLNEHDQIAEKELESDEEVEYTNKTLNDSGIYYLRNKRGRTGSDSNSKIRIKY